MTELQWLEENLLSMPPEIYAALANRVFAVALQQILWGAVMFIVGIVSTLRAQTIFRRGNKDFEEWGWMFALVAVIVFAIATANLSGAIARVNGPEYYILQYIKNGLFSG